MIQKRIAKKIITSLLVFGGILLFRLALAQDFGTEIINNNLGGSLGSSGSDPRSIIANIINITLGFLGLIAIGLVLYAGFLWMTSNGEDDKVSRAKQILKNGLIGLVIILSAWAIVTFVISKLGGAIGGGGEKNDPNSPSYCLSSLPCGCGGYIPCVNGFLGNTCIDDNPADCVNPPTSCNVSTLPGVCQPNNQVCAEGYFCSDTCACESQGNFGDSCNADLTNQTCEADNNKCSEYLTCNPDTCLCGGSPVITAVSPVGGFCNSNINQPCSRDSDCVAGDVCNQTAPNGTANNFVTIFGKNFGAYAPEVSKVLFTGTGDDIEALAPSAVNSACIDSWRDDQIIITIPNGVSPGPIKVVNEENLIDSSADSYGPKLTDFIPNEISRPGLCALDPVEGSLNKEVNYQGINLYSGKAYFGNYVNNVGGLYSQFNDTSGLSGQAAVPNIKSGNSGSFVERNVAGLMQKSNYLKFVKEREAAEGPYIVSISPEEGPAGQYVTITGAGFGGARGFSRVYFVSGSNKIEASYVFPAICINSVWKDKQVIVKAPATMTDGEYYLEIVLGDKTISSLNARPNVFKFNSKLPLAPSLCKIDPDKGPIGTPVKLWGEYFGSLKSEVIAKFNYEKTTTGVITSQGDAQTTTVNVPQGAVTGPVKLVKDSKNSNELNFLVAECLSDSECKDQVCCPQNTYKKGRCVSDLEECFLNIPNSVFEWRFSTNFSSTINPELASCLGFAKNFGACYQGAMCPNSPGSCSSPSTSYTKVVGTCNANCNDVPGCKNNACSYNDKLDKCVLLTDNIISDCETGELIAPAKDSNPNDDKNIPRVMFWSGKVNQHWNLSEGAWESDINEDLNAEIDKVTYCKKFYPTTVRAEDYKLELSTTWRETGSRTYYSGERMSYRCILDTTTGELDFAGVKKTCNANSKWEIKVKTSCPENWTKGPNNTCTQDNTNCNSCPLNFSCNKIELFNSCVSDKLCKDAQATCVDNPVSDKDDCVVTVEPGCDCCCRIGFDAQDCCAYQADNGTTVQLTCGGTCGSDVSANPSTNTYGSCSGCAAAGSTQEKRDDACNCLGTSGKFCSITDATPQGICTDCASLTTPESCGDHSGTCCFDSNKTATTSDDFCRAIGESEVVSTDKDSPDYGYCGYFSCSEVKPLICSGLLTKIGKYKTLTECNETCPKERDDICNTFNNNKESCLGEKDCCYEAKKQGGVNKCVSGNKITEGENAGYCAYYNCSTDNPSECNNVASTTGKFKNISDCQSICLNPPKGVGLNCSDKTNSALNQCNFNLCSFAGFQCLQDNGLESMAENYPDCGVCCCQPANESEGIVDSCISPNTPDLRCTADKGSCTGENRGLCCGCSKDSDCGSATTVGCGLDSCCEARPAVSETLPAASSKNVCRNAAITISFNQKMNTNSFTNNFFLFEERNYSQGPCPEGTFISAADLANDYLAKSDNLIIRLWQGVKRTLSRIFNSELVLATPPDSNKLYCSVSGRIGFSEENKKTSLIFTPDKVLAPATKYFVLVKGDETLTSNSGVLSASKIGMNEKGFRDSAGNLSSPVIFNKKSYLNSYSFEFTTLANQNGKTGICEIDSVKINPASHLFKTTANDLNENDKDIGSDTFDSVADGDKLFTANAYSSDNQLLTPVTGYNWNWTWNINDLKVAKISSAVLSATGNNKLIIANTEATDGQTQVNAKINMDAYRASSGCGANCNSMFVGDKLNKNSDVYVFVCNNPWPAVKSDGSWRPWQDTACVDGACDNFNYKFYYCRDAGQPGTFDDLPVINHTPVSLSGNLICSLDKTSCSAAGSPCGSDNAGVCIWEILKESYFFREAVLTGVDFTGLTDTKIGGEVQVEWQSAVEGVNSYKIYYLKSGQGTMLSKEVKPTGANGVCKLDTSAKNYKCSTKIGGLVNGEPYVFKISLISQEKTESAFSNERTATTSDKTPPSAPLNLKATLGGSQVKFSWSKDIDPSVFYRLYYGIGSGQYSQSIDTSANVNELVVLANKFTEKTNYYLAVTALDKAKNESAKSAEKQVLFYNGQAWVRALSSSEAPVGASCLVKMDTSLASSTQPICDNNTAFANPGWFSGIIKQSRLMLYCYLDSCGRSFTPDRCNDPARVSNPWTNNCYILSK